MGEKYNYFELLYVYIGNIGRCFYDQEFNFSTEYNISYNKENKKLIIEKTNNKDHLKYFFDENISNINLVVGKNGCGKSTLFELLGDLNISCNFTCNDVLIRQGWFAIYKTNIENHFYIEGKNKDFLNIKDTINRRDFNYSHILSYDFKTKTFNSIEHNAVFNEHFYIYYNKKDFSSPYHIKNFRSNIGYSNLLSLKRKYIQNKNFSDLYYLTTNNKDYISYLNLDDLSLQMNIYYVFKPSNHEVFDQIMQMLEEKYIEHKSSNIKEDIECQILLNEINSLFNDTITDVVKQNEFVDKMVSIIENTSNFSKKLRDTFYEAYKYSNIEGSGIIGYDYNEFILDLIENIKALPDEYFLLFHREIDKYTKISYLINIPIKETLNHKVHSFLKVYDKENTIGKKVRDIKGSFNKEFSLHVNRNISDGELQLLMTYASIYHIMEQCSEKQKSCLIILDEPEMGFHPEWISKFINDLVQLVKSMRNKEITYQFLISTHSPFMLSDVPKEFITTIDIQEDEDGNHIRVVDKPKQSFASNYYDIIKDSFFLDNAIGSFALNKIRNIHEILYNSLSQLKDNKTITKQEVLKQLNKEVHITSEGNLLKIIDEIGEPLIKIQLHNLWNELKKLWSNNTSSFVKTLSNEEKEKLYNELKKEFDK